MEFTKFEIELAVEIERLGEEILDCEVGRCKREELERIREVIKRRRYLKEVLGGQMAKKISRLPWV